MPHHWPAATRAFVWPQTKVSARMTDNVRDWLSFAIGFVALLLTLYGMFGSPRLSSREVITSFKGGGMEWTKIERESRQF